MLNGPNPEDFTTEEAVLHWNQTSQRMQRPCFLGFMSYAQDGYADDNTAAHMTILCSLTVNKSLAVFYTRGRISVWMNLGKYLLFIWLFVSSIHVKTGLSCIVHLDELSSVVYLE